MYSPKGFKANTFFTNSDRDFYSENNNVSQGYIIYQKYKGKVKKKTLLSSMLKLKIF
jgi:hypothetical protein